MDDSTASEERDTASQVNVIRPNTVVKVSKGDEFSATRLISLQNCFSMSS